MQLQVASAVTMALALALAACSSTPAQTLPTEPVDETDSLPTLTPVVTDSAEPTAPPTGTGGGSTDNGNGWPATVTATIGGTTESNGTYSASGPARLCGNPIASIDPTAHLFGFEFPLDGTFNPRDVAFGADELVAGSATALFHVGVNIMNSEGREPAATVINPDLPDKGDTGTATLTEADGKRTVTLQATNHFGETIQLTAVCGPAPPA